MGKKYLKIGQIIKTDGMKQPAIVLENANIGELVDFLREYGKKNNLRRSKEEIYADKTLKSIFINIMDTFDNQPALVLNNLTLTIETDDEE